MKNRFISLAIVTLVGALLATRAAAQIPLYDHVVILIEENKSYSEIIGHRDPSTGAPYLNSIADSGALFTNSHAVEHPSQPNYLDLYSGFNQGVIGDNISPLAPFTTANLGASLVSHGYSFADYSENLPYSLPSNRNVAVAPGTPGATAYGYLGTSYTGDPGLNEYERKHNPSSNWQNESNPAANQLPATTNQPFTAFPSDFSSLPTVSLIVPNEQHDMHDGTINQGDVWAAANIEAYRQWAQTHNSLLIATWDENDDTNPGDPGFATNQVATIFSGDHVLAGQYGELITHFNVLRTLDDMYGLSPSNVGDQNATPITDVFAVPEPSVFSLSLVAGAIGLLWVRLFPRKKAMRRRKKALLYTCLAFGAITLLPGALRASTAIAPNNLPDPNSSGTLPATETYGDTSNLFPFFPGAGNALRYQQVYDASQFSAFAGGGEEITQIAFRVGIDTPGRLDHGVFSALVPLVQITLSTTGAAPDGLSDSFAANTGADAVTVFGTPGVGSPLALSSAGDVGGDPAPFDIVITLTSPFFYNPAQGNLLLDVQNYSGADSPTGVEFDGTFVDGDSVSRVLNFGDANASDASDSDTLGLVTEFVAVPEPGEASLLALGGSALLLFLHHHRRSLKKI